PRIAVRRLDRGQLLVDREGGEELRQRSVETALGLEQRAEVAVRVGKLAPPLELAGVFLHQPPGDVEIGLEGLPRRCEIALLPMHEADPVFTLAEGEEPFAVLRLELGQ